MKTNPVTPIEYMKMLKVKDQLECGLTPSQKDLKLMLDLMIRMYDELEKQ
jgi:hypothetical protein